MWYFKTLGIDECWSSIFYFFVKLRHLLSYEGEQYKVLWEYLYKNKINETITIIKVVGKSHLSITHLVLRAPASVRGHSFIVYSHRFPEHTNAGCLSIMLLLSGGIVLNQGPVNLRLVNSCSIRNKEPLSGDTIVSNNLDILALPETHIQIYCTDSLLKSVTPFGFQLTHRPRTTGRSVIVGILTGKELPTKIVDALTFSTFENIVISVATLSKSFVIAYVYRTPGLCSLAFLMTSCFCGFLSSLISSFTICDFNVHVDTDCIDQQKFLNLVDSSNLVQSVNKPTHLHGHILDLILSPSDSNFVGNVKVGDLVLDHTLVKCHLNFACPALPKIGSIYYRRCNKLDMLKFCDDLADISFILSPDTSADLYDQYVHDIGCL